MSNQQDLDDYGNEMRELRRENAAMRTLLKSMIEHARECGDAPEFTSGYCITTEQYELACAIIG